MGGMIKELFIHHFFLFINADISIACQKRIIYQLASESLIEEPILIKVST